MKTRFTKILALMLAVIISATAMSFAASADLTAVTYRTGANSISSSYAGSQYYANFQKIMLTGDGRTDTLALALSQLGYMESNSAGDYAGTTAGSGNYTEYCYNMGSVGGYGYQWCATFCSWSLLQARCTDQNTTSAWCRNHLGSGSSYIWREVGCAYWATQLQYNGYYQKSAYNGGSYTPQPGDLIFFYSSGGINHIGFVVYTSGGYVYTVEGNTGGSAGVVANGGRVCAKSYSLSSSSIAGYGVLPYKVVDNEYTNIDYSGGTRTPGYYNNPDAAKYIYSDEACTSSLGVVARYTMFEVTKVCASGKVLCNATLDNGTVVTGYMDPSASRIIQITASGTPALSQDYINLQNLIENTKELICVDYTASEAIAIRAAYANACNVLNSDTATDADYASAYNTLYSAINPTANVVTTGKYYTRTAPARDDGYADDNVRLTDGVKGQPDGGAAGHSGWSGSVDIVVELGEKTKMNTFTAYLAAGAWGIDVPNGNITMEIQYSDDNVNFTKLSSTNYAILKKGTGANDETWSTYEITLSTSEISAKYVKFTLADANGSHIWLDEVEASYYTEYFLSDKLYVNGVNSFVTAGDCIIFTPAFGTVTTENANHRWTYNVVAKWNESRGGYVVTSSSQGIGDDTAAVTLASDEILIAAHCWEGDGAEDTVPGSALNHYKLSKTKVGDLIQLSNITVSLGYYDVLAYASITYSEVQECDHNYVASVTAPTCTAQGYTTHTCSLCGDSYVDNYVSASHTEGEWVTLADGSKEKRCSACGTLLDSEPAPDVTYETGDVNADGKVNMFDYMLIKSFCMNKAVPTEDQAKRADVNGNGNIDMFDYIIVKSVCFQ